MMNTEQAFQVSPEVQEDEMSKIKALFDRAANAIVDATDLAKKLAKLQSDFDQLRAEVEAVRSQNRWLDEMLASVRKQRDEFQTELTKVRMELMETQQVRDCQFRTLDQHVATISGLNTSLTDARKARDDAEFQVLDLEERNKELQKQLDAIRGVLGVTPVSTFNPLIEPKPAEETKPVENKETPDWLKPVSNW